MANQFSPVLIEDRTESKYINPLNNALRIFFKNALTISLKNPSHALYFLQTVKNQQKAARIRTKLKKQGIHVPPIMIMSITNSCNLRCKGCYHHALREVGRPEMSTGKLYEVIAEARDLGTSFIVLAGGEPLVRKDILDITADFPEIIFLMFTNGTLITDEMAVRFKEQKNIVPLISLEGHQSDTDDRRGVGIYSNLQEIIRKLQRNNVFFGASLTLTRDNFDTITDDSFIGNLNESGCKLILIIEYSPIEPGTEGLMITDQQRNQLESTLKNFRSKYSALFVSVPGDEKDFGGCLSAGRGFVHISAEGDVEPCPFAPYSDTNVREYSLRDALQSNFLKAIRESENHVHETGGSCALFAKKEWVKSLLVKSLLDNYSK